MHVRLSCVVLTLTVVAIIKAEEVVKDDKVKVEIIRPPAVDCKRTTKKHDKIAVHFVGTVTETGEKFDSSHDRDELFGFQLGTGQVVKGWEEGLLDMCVGEKRKLVIPPSKGFGAQGAGDAFPPNVGLTFEIELHEIRDAAAPPNVFLQIDKDKDNRLSPDEVSDYLKKRPKEQDDEGKKEERTEKEHQELMSQVFLREDTDKDGFISHAEFTGPKHENTNTDGIVSNAEFTAPKHGEL